MGLQDRDYYREHHRDRERRNEASLASSSVSSRSWFGRLAVLALACAVVYLGVQNFQLRRQLAHAERIVHQQTEQMRADRQRTMASPTIRPTDSAPARPHVEFFKP